MVIDFDDLGEEGVIQHLESMRRLSASVRAIDTRDIEWDDSHPLNSETHWREKFDELFGGAPVAVENGGLLDAQNRQQARMNAQSSPATLQVDALTDEQIGAMYMEAQDQGASGVSPALHLARAVEKHVIAATRQAGPVQHDSDCSTNNGGVPELLGPCDCEPEPTQEQLDAGCMMLLSCTASELESYSQKLLDGYEYEVRRIYRAMRKAAPVQAAPEGWQLVPVKLTSEMLKCIWGKSSQLDLPDAYRAMLAAAPAPRSAA